jgi:hypothetical protein
MNADEKAIAAVLASYQDLNWVSYRRSNPSTSPHPAVAKHPLAKPESV